MQVALGFVALLRLAPGEAGALPCGDLDGNGVVNSADARLLRQHRVGLIPLTTDQAIRCDVIGEVSRPVPLLRSHTSGCSPSDAVVMARQGEGLRPEIDERCPAADAIDPASRVEVTSSCLTLGTQAQAVVVTTLTDLAGDPVTGASLNMEATEGFLSGVSSSGHRYWAVLTPPADSATGTTIQITADGVPLDTRPTISFEAPATGLSGGAGGCPADGNVRVKVVDENGLVIPGANVMIGSSEITGLYETTYLGAPDGATTALTNASGIAELRDFGSHLDGPLTVTAAAAEHQYLSLIDVDASDFVLPLPRVNAAIATGTASGAVLSLPAPDGAPIEFGAVVRAIHFDELVSLRVASLFGDNECYGAGGLVGDLLIPRNLYVPAQCAVTFGLCIQNFSERRYSVEVEGGARLLFSYGAAAPLSLLAGGGFSALSERAFDFVTTTGLAEALITPGGGTAVDVPLVASLTRNVTCSVRNAPAGSTVACLTGGDWDSGGFSSMTPGEGRLFLMGFATAPVSPAPSPVVLQLTSVAATPPYALIDYLGGAIVSFSGPGAPAPIARGSTGIFDRSGTSFDQSGGSLIFDDFLPIRPLLRSGRDFELGALPGGTYPPADYTRTRITQVVTERYQACSPDDSERVTRQDYWQIIAPGDANGFTLPTPAAGWPRQALGGDLAGLLDVTATPESDTIEWSSQTVHEGLNPSFDYDTLSLFSFRSFATHVSTNANDY